MGSIDLQIESHPEVKFRLHPTEDRYLGICTKCGWSKEVFPLTDDARMTDLVAAWELLKHSHKANV